jgi:hypothetical protein
MSVLDFLNEVAAKSDSNFSGTFSGGFGPQKFMLSEAGVDYYHSILWSGFELWTHNVKGSFKPSLCLNKYYGESCPECGKESNYPVDENDPSKGKRLTRPSRNRYIASFCHNNNGKTRLSKDGSVVYNVEPVVVIEIKCGEANTQTGAAKNRNIEPILLAENQDVLYDEIFVLRRDMVKDPKTGKDKSVNKQIQLVSGKAKLNYSIMCHEGDKDKGITEKELKVAMQAQELVNQVPEEIKEKWFGPPEKQMVVGEKVGIILSIMEPNSVRRDLWEAKGAIFPPEVKKKDTKEAEKTSSSDIEKDAEG